MNVIVKYGMHIVFDFVKKFSACGHKVEFGNQSQNEAFSLVVFRLEFRNDQCILAYDWSP